MIERKERRRKKIGQKRSEKFSVKPIEKSVAVLGWMAFTAIICIIAGREGSVALLLRCWANKIAAFLQQK